MKNNIQNFPPSIRRAALRSHSMRGYTLIEIMLVLSIISVLLGAGIYYMVGNLDSAKERRVQADIAMFTIQLKSYESENFFMPTTEQGLMALYKEPSSDPKPRRWRQWLEKPPIDPWGLPYVYKNPGTHNPNGFDLYSYGSAKKENDKEIGNWDDTPGK